MFYARLLNIVGEELTNFNQNATSLNSGDQDALIQNGTAVCLGEVI